MLTSTAAAMQSLDQFISTWKLLIKPFPNVDLLDKPGIATSWADVPFMFYNALFLTEPISDPRLLRERMDAAITYMRAKTHPGLLVVCDDILAAGARKELSAIAEEELLVPFSLTGMEGDILPLQERSVPELRFEPICDDAVMRDSADLNSISYNLPVQAGRSIVGEKTQWSSQAYGFVAYENDQPVSTASAIVNDDYLLLFLVATMPQARRKGYADAVVRRALNTAYEQTGIQKTVLHATDAGYPVYEQIGCRPTGRFTGYTLGTATSTSKSSS